MNAWHACCWYGATSLAKQRIGGARCRMSMTHEEIGEFIGASRETVTRTLSIFKNRHLVAQHGCTITIPSRLALESYARDRLELIFGLAVRLESAVWEGIAGLQRAAILFCATQSAL